VEIEGRLRVDLYPAGGRVNRVSIRSSRPVQAARIFTGKSPQTVLAELPMLFSVCGIAQSVAGLQAFRQAQALPVSAATDTASALLVQMETAREHLWRILIDWPAFLDEADAVRRAGPLPALLTDLRKVLFADGPAFSLQAEPRLESRELQAQIERLDTLLAEQVFDCPSARWLEITCIDELSNWACTVESVAARLLRDVWAKGWQELGATDVGFLPALPAAGLNRRLDAPDADGFIAAPLWEESVCETTSLERQHTCELVTSLRREFGNGLLTRLAARLVELARVPTILRLLVAQPDAPPVAENGDALPPGVGIGQVEAARGRLVHRVVLDGGQVQRYQIVAPTEWNFHPAGVVARGLETLTATGNDTLRRQAALLISAIDPCVGYDLSVN